VVDPLITPPDLADALGSERPPVVLDVRWQLGGPPGRDSYRDGHLPGAVFVDLDDDLAAAPGEGGRHPLPDPAAFGAAMRGAGVSNGRGVVVYDDADATSAARAWWLLRHHGHPDVRVLDGGLRAWVGDGRELVPGEERPPPGDFTAMTGAPDVLDAESAAAVARDGVLLDARTLERYRGAAEPVDPVAGHIPGAVSAPAAGNVEESGRFRTPAELRARFAELGADGSRPVGAYCGSGVTAAQEILALTVAGVPASLYAGSWSDWIRDSARTVATGDAP
jgi:thiosulfate/3-mercaptopyruvate sulfurtransferase